ncbi:ATP-binding protein [Actinocorallia sp. API 0066]|uniref:sensor histidine kinase n=1 Tax=Actinocorallia sp. API 0066 TaxID=2896846 RepID=UPI001E334CA6|nr:ATP-binding protein [Actinocorallia sp. API 0066]MCD0452725.1 ATP-binding protein [Actinocorallia sp. API 0066]
MGGLKRRRTRSIRRMIVSLLAVPVVALVVLWGVILSVTLQDSLRLLAARDYVTMVVEPVRNLTISLQAERRMSMAFLGEDPAIGPTGLQAQRAITDRTANAVRAHTGSGGYQRATNELTRTRTRDLLDRMAGIDELRQAVTTNKIDRADALRQYTDFIVAANLIYDAAEAGDGEIHRDTRVQVSLADAFELLNYEDALLAGALTAGAPTPAEHAAFVKTVGAQRARYAELIRQMNPADAAKLNTLHKSQHYRTFSTLEDALIADRGTPRAPTVDIGTWRTAAERWHNDLTAYASDTQAELAARSYTWARDRLVRLTLITGVGFAAIVIAVVVGYRLARRLIVENRSMVRELDTFTHEKLPAIPALVQEGAEIELESDVREGDYTIAEIARVFEAFDTSRRAVIAATVSEAAARRGLSAVFVNLARRNQVLLRRLLRLLDGMERKAATPEDLDDLFAIDHLVTRMRRHAEGLVILAGQSTGRTWRRPVPLMDVVRGAVAEVEDYTRVKVSPVLPEAALSGTVAADVIHLLAELVENALMYSPPEMRVEVTGHLVAHGLAVEIEDRGLGLDEAKLASFNETLAEAPDFDLFDSARLGLFVVARLAKRHEIRVRLKPSPYGGVTAIALIPGALLAQQEPVPVPQAAPEPPGVDPGAQENRHRVRPEPVVVKVPDREGELPKRVRQRSLAPQLRAQGGDGTATAETGEERDAAASGPGQPVIRPPEEARSVLSAMQQGWQRGRAEIQAREEGREDRER